MAARWALLGRKMKNIGVIGSGAAGLCAARHILANNGLTPVVWEQSEKVGGTWNYTPETGTDKHGLPIHSSMYQNLKTNLPKEVMAFPDFPFPESNESFLHHSQVLKYLECYAENFDLYPYIKFSHHVEEVKPIFKDIGPPTWSVKAKDLNSNESTTTICDALLVCNGHYSVPRMPVIKDIEKFKGLQIHSHNYREPTPFKGLRIVVLGAAASGLDIMLELASQAKEIFLSHNLPVPIPSDLPSNVRQVRGVTAATENGFIIADGTSIDADVIVYCTGYEYTFPFLSEECNVTIEENIVKPLYKHLIHSSFPSLAFVGIPFQVCPFPLFDFQVQFFLKTIMGQFTLPSKKEMEEITMKDLEGHQNDGLPSKHFHKMGNIQWPYNDQLAKKSGIAPLPPVVAKLYMAVSQSRKSNLMSYKTASYKITDADSFVRVRYFTKVLCGALVLPSKQEMDADTHKEYEYRKNIGLRDKHFHKMAKLHWKYSDSIAQAAGLKPMPYSVQYFMAVITGRFTLPTPSEMARLTNEELEHLRKDGYSDRHYHRLGLLPHLTFMEKSAKEAGIPPPGTHLKTILFIVMLRYILSHRTFKQSCFSVRKGGHVVEKRGGAEVFTKLELSWLLMRGLFCLLWKDLPRTVRFLGSLVWYRLTKIFH